MAGVTGANRGRLARAVGTLALLVLAALILPGAGRPDSPPPLGMIALTGDLRPTLVPRVYAVDLTSRERIDLASSEGGWDPALSPDGRRLAFVSARGGFQALYIAGADGSDPRRLTDEIDGTPWFGGGCPASESNPVWSPDGRQIVFEVVFGVFCAPPTASARRLSYSVPEPHRLAVVDADGSGLRVLPVDGFEPRWSPDGTRLAYVERSTGSFSATPGATSGILRLADGVSRSLGPGTAPTWAGDGGAVALAGHGTVRVFDADGRLLRAVRGAAAGWTRCGLVVGPSGSVAISPNRRTAAVSGASGVVERTCGRRARLLVRGHWQPISYARRGGRLLVGRCKGERCALAVVAGSRLVAVRGPKAVGEPTWSPDGRRLAFVGPGGAVVVAPAAGGRAATLAVEGDDSLLTRPAWDGDSTLLYGARDTGFESNLYLLDPTTGGAHLVAGQVQEPAWSPDGETLAFQKDPGIWLAASAGTARPKLLLRTAITGMAWSPDGVDLAFSDSSSVLIADRTGAVRRVIGPAEGLRLSAWSPDGSWLAYTVQAYGSDPGVWLVHPDGSGNHLLVPQATDLVWSPDGSRIAYIEDSRLWVADADGSAAVALPGGFEPVGLAWSTAGVLVLRAVQTPVVPSLGDLFPQLLLVAPDGSGDTALTTAGTVVFAAAWQPRP